MPAPPVGGGPDELGRKVYRAGAVDRRLLHVREPLLGTSSIKDYADFAEHELGVTVTNHL